MFNFMFSLDFAPSSSPPAPIPCLSALPKREILYMTQSIVFRQFDFLLVPKVISIWYGALPNFHFLLHNFKVKHCFQMSQTSPDKFSLSSQYMKISTKHSTYDVIINKSFTQIFAACCRSINYSGRHSFWLIWVCEVLMGIIFQHEHWVHQNRCAGAHVNPSWISCPDCLMHGIHGVWSCVTNGQIDGWSCSGMNAPSPRSIIHWIALDLIINESNAFNGKMIQSCLIPLTMLMWNPKIKRERRWWSYLFVRYESFSFNLFYCTSSAHLFGAG